VDTKKTALIVTDGTDPARKLAEQIAAALAGRQVTIRPAESFEGTDLLPASAFFIGCETPNPPSFAYLAEMLAHINLAGRPCGIFSGSAKALKYLSGLVQDSEAALGEPFLVNEAESSEIRKWVAGIVGQEAL
jgi:hypothetical protein